MTAIMDLFIFDILNLVLIFLWIVYIWETYLSYRQRKLCQSVRDVPSELKDVLDQETFEKARLYSLDRNNFEFWIGLYSQCETTLILKFFGIPFAWMKCGELIAYFEFNKDYEIIQSLLFLVLYAVCSTLKNLPGSLYSTFVIDERHGVNKQTVGFFFKDLVKKLFVGLAIALPLTAMLLYIIKNGGTYFFLYSWLFILVASLLMITVYADYIAPLFDRFTPLPEGELRSSIETLAASVDFPPEKIFVLEGSKRSSHSGAYFYGFHKNKRIVLFDTLIEDYVSNREMKEEDKATNRKTGCNKEEVLAVLAHELGHWKLNHVPNRFKNDQVCALLSLMVLPSLMNKENLFVAFGFVDCRPTVIVLIFLFQLIFPPYNGDPHFEYQADRFAVSLGYAVHLRSALVKSCTDNLDFPVTDWLYSTIHFSHPPLLERLAALDKTE